MKLREEKITEFDSSDNPSSGVRKATSFLRRSRKRAFSMELRHPNCATDRCFAVSCSARPPGRYPVSVLTSLLTCTDASVRVTKLLLLPWRPLDPVALRAFVRTLIDRWTNRQRRPVGHPAARPARGIDGHFGKQATLAPLASASRCKF